MPGLLARRAAVVPLQEFAHGSFDMQAGRIQQRRFSSAEDHANEMHPCR